jgi:hypothetical protein
LYVLADNKLALNAGWDKDILAIELQGLVDLDFDDEVCCNEPCFCSCPIRSVPQCRSDHPPIG